MKKHLLRAAAVLIVVVLMVVATRSWWLPVPGEWLDVSGPVEPADIIFVLSGQSLWRAKGAARLYQQHYAPHVVASAGNTTDLLLLVTGERITESDALDRMLTRLGVPRDVTTIIGGSTSTREDADVFGRYVRSHHVQSAIVVTSHLHSRRARWTIRRALDDFSIKVQFVEADQPFFTASQWWQNEDGLVTVFGEYLKFAFYLTHY